MEFWKNLWLKIFGTTEWLGLNMGFWVSMFAVVVLVVVMIVTFWLLKPLVEQSHNSDCPQPIIDNETEDKK